MDLEILQIKKYAKNKKLNFGILFKKQKFELLDSDGMLNRRICLNKIIANKVYKLSDFIHEPQPS